MNNFFELSMAGAIIITATYLNIVNHSWWSGNVPQLSNEKSYISHVNWSDF